MTTIQWIASSIQNAKLEWGIVWYFPTPIVKLQIGLKFTKGNGTFDADVKHLKNKEGYQNMNAEQNTQHNLSKIQREIYKCTGEHLEGALFV